MVNRTNATVFEEDDPHLDTTEFIWIVTYEFMFGVCGVYLLEALLVAYWLYPFVMKVLASTARTQRTRQLADSQRIAPASPVSS